MDITVQPVFTDQAPAPIGPYSQGILLHNTLLFLSGQIPMDAEGRVIDGDIAAQTHKVIANIQAVLASANLALANVVKTTVFLTDMNDFTAMNTVYNQYFSSTKPARSTVEVSRLPKDVQVEIEVIAVRS